MNIYVKAMMEGARRIESAMTEADDDWTPALMVITAEGQTSVVDVAAFFASDEYKRVFGEVVLPKLIEDMDVQELVIIASSWIGRPVADLDDPDWVRPSEDPERQECLAITLITAEGATLWLAPIDRDQRGGVPPKLGEFTTLDGNPTKGTTTGVLIDGALQKLQERAA